MHQIDPILKLKEVSPIVNRSISAINRDRRLGTFPAPVRLGHRSVGWRMSHIEQWLAARESLSAGKEG